MFDRPKTSKGGVITATKTDAIMIELTGEFTSKWISRGSVGFTSDQIERLAAFYGLAMPRGDGDEAELERAVNERELFRHLEIDGLRVMAFLSRYLGNDRDPVRLLQEMAVDCGFDVPDLTEEPDG